MFAPVREWVIGIVFALTAVSSPAGASAQAANVRLNGPDAAIAARPPVTIPQSSAGALIQDAADYARRHRVTLDAAVMRLRALQASAEITDRIRRSYQGRLAGISIDHEPFLRIVVLLTGAEPVADATIVVGGMALPVAFRTGAKATGDDVIRAMLQRDAALHAILPNARGMGLDERTGELVILITAADAARSDLGAIKEAAEALTGVPVRLDLADRPVENLALAGGARIEGVDPADGKRYACTTGFVVSDGTRTGIATAAHCPDELVFQDPDGGSVPLAFVGQWGARTQDVQINLSPASKQPLFYADRHYGALRMLAGVRTRLSTRAGEWLCHYGEGSGYSCSEVELTNFAPPGQLCGGICAPTWVTVRTRDCRSGDSGGPVFSGDVAFGITKGGSGGRSTRCNFYFYMSTDFLPAGWRLLR